MKDFLWVEKYRPQRVADTILPKELKAAFQGYVTEGGIPQLILTGKSGIGKTTVAKAMLEELGCDYIVVNGSNEGRKMDTLNNEIAGFASSLSMIGKRKYVIVDEADGLPELVQKALRGFMEQYAKNCGFIITCNYLNKLLPAMHSRSAVIEFKIPKDEKADLAAQFYKRLLDILKAENIEADKKVLGEMILKHFPDFRRVLNELQRYSKNGKIDSGILTNMKADNIKSIIEYMKEKNFTKVRKWVGENSDADSDTFFREFYDQASTYFTAAGVPQLVLTINDYQFKAAFVIDKEINMVAFFTEVMINCEMK